MFPVHLAYHTVKFSAAKVLVIYTIV